MKHICVIGNDRRMEYIAEYFYNLGYEISKSLYEIKDNSIVICKPVIDKTEEKDLCNKIKKTNYLFIGKVSQTFEGFLNKNKIMYYQYLKDKLVTTENAILTAKGIIKEASNYNSVIEESHCLVTGYGYCGKALAFELFKHNANVDVLVRNKELKNEIQKNNYGYYNFSDINTMDLSKYSYVFNTVPAIVFTKNEIDKCSKNIMIYDIASGMGGVDANYCLSNNIFYHQSLGIPGKYYPGKAGEIIANAINKIISTIIPL
ncbi:MAG: hypothetical protein PUG10_07980 [Lachnospiraceae bacterium]|nr:hypothetical protein [Lachnospiraceae bacterium]